MEPQRVTPPIFKGLHLKEDPETADDIERKIADLREKATEKRQNEQREFQIAAAKDKEEKFKRLDELREQRDQLTQLTNMSTKLSKEDAMELVSDKQANIRKIEELEKELGFREIEDPKVQTKKTFGLSSSKALWAIGGLTLLSFILFWLMGTAVIQDDPMNDSARRMMNSVGLRVLTNFLPFSMAILTAVGFIWLLFPSVFAYWHSKVSTNLSLITDLEQCEPYQRVGFFAFAYGLPVWAFVQLMQVIFG
jgi:hypothetical protein